LPPAFCAPSAMDSIRGVTVSFHDPSGVWQFLESHIQAAVPLHHVGILDPLSSAEVVVPSLRVDFTAYSRDKLNANRGWAPDWLAAPSAHLYLLVCETVEAYKATEAGKVSAWVEEVTSMGGEWMVWHAGIGQQEQRDNNDVYRRLLSDLDANDRCARLSVFEQKDNRGPEAALGEALQKLSRVIVSAFSRLCERLMAQMTRVDDAVFQDAYLVKDSLVVAMARVGLRSQTFSVIEEMEHLAHVHFRQRDFDDDVVLDLQQDQLGHRLLDIRFSYEKILAGKMTWFNVAQHLFSRKASIWNAMGRHADHLRDALTFLKSSVAGLTAHDFRDDDSEESNRRVSTFAAAWGVAAIAHILRVSSAAQHLAADGESRSPMASRASSLSSMGLSAAPESASTRRIDHDIPQDYLESYRHLCSLYEYCKTLLVQYLCPGGSIQYGRLPFRKEIISELQDWKPLPDAALAPADGQNPQDVLMENLPSSMRLKKAVVPDELGFDAAVGQGLGLQEPAGHRFYEIGDVGEVVNLPHDMERYRALYTDILNMANEYYTAAGRQNAAAVVKCEAADLLMAHGDVTKAAKLLRSLTRHFKRSNWPRISAWAFTRYAMCCVALRWWDEYANTMLELMEPHVTLWVSHTMMCNFLSSLIHVKALLDQPLARRTERLFQFELKFLGKGERSGEHVKYTFEAGQAIKSVLTIRCCLPESVTFDSLVVTFASIRPQPPNSPEGPGNLDLAAKGPVKLKPGVNSIDVSCPAGRLLPITKFLFSQILVEWGSISFIVESSGFGLDSSRPAAVEAPSGSIGSPRARAPVLEMRKPTSAPGVTVLYPPIVDRNRSFEVCVILAHPNLKSVQQAAGSASVGARVDIEVDPDYELSTAAELCRFNEGKLGSRSEKEGTAMSPTAASFFVLLPGRWDVWQDMKDVLILRLRPRKKASTDCAFGVTALYACPPDEDEQELPTPFYSSEVKAEVGSRLDVGCPFDVKLRTRLLSRPVEGEAIPAIAAQAYVMPRSVACQDVPAQIDGLGWCSSDLSRKTATGRAIYPRVFLNVSELSLSLPTGWDARVMGAPGSEGGYSQGFKDGECLSCGFIGEPTKATAALAGRDGSDSVVKLRFNYTYRSMLAKVKRMFGPLADVSGIAEVWSFSFEKEEALAFSLPRIVENPSRRGGGADGSQITFSYAVEVVDQGEGERQSAEEFVPRSSASSIELEFGFRVVDLVYHVSVSSGYHEDEYPDLLYKFESNSCWMIHSKQCGILAAQGSDTKKSMRQWEVPCKAVPFKMGNLPLPTLKVWRATGQGTVACEVFPSMDTVTTWAGYHGPASFLLPLPMPEG